MIKNLKFENRAWKGTRLVSEPMKVDDIIYIFTIGYHHVLEKYIGKVEKTYLNPGAYRVRAFPGEKPSFAKIEFYGKTPQEVLRKFEKKYHFKAKLKDPLIKK